MMMAVFFLLPQPLGPLSYILSRHITAATVKPPNIIAHEKGFKCHANPITDLSN